MTASVRDYVADHELDTAVVGSHGRSNLEKQLLGGVTSNLLRTVDVPALVVKRRS